MLPRILGSTTHSYENFKTGFLDHPLSKLQYFPHDKKELTILLLGRMCQTCQEGEKSLGRPVSVKDPMFLIFPVLVCTSFFLYSVVIFHWMSCVYLSVSLSVVNNQFQIEFLNFKNRIRILKHIPANLKNHH